MSTRLLGLALLLVACSAAHPTTERFPFCNPGNRCPVEDHRCLPTATMGMRCLPTVGPCLPGELSAIFANVGACFPPGDHEPGEVCEHVYDCVEGYVCEIDPDELVAWGHQGYTFHVPFNDPPRCRARCDARPADGGVPAAACPNGQSCSGYNNSAQPGICIEPCDSTTNDGCREGELCYCGQRCYPAALQVEGCEWGCPLGTFCTEGCPTPAELLETCSP